MSPPAPTESQTTAAGRQAFREVSLVLGLTVALLAGVVVVEAFAEHTAATIFGVVAVVVALAAALVVTRRARRVVGQRSTALDEARRARELLDRTLAASRRLAETDSPLELRRQICEVARDVFGSSGVSLWEVEATELRLLERVPWAHPYTGGDRRAIADLPGLREALDHAQPLFVDDVRERGSGLFRANAEVLGTVSILGVPVAVGGVAQLALVLSWDERQAAPGTTQRVAVQRFADQAGLALEQARYRTAQSEIASLNRTLSRMVQTDPLFHAGGTPEEVAAAVCTEALAVFEADAAALWVDVDDGIELLHRVPGAPIFGPRQRILFEEHGGFADDLGAGHPHFLADVEHDDPVLWERFAKHSRSRSQLRLPLASGGHARALIVLSWERLVAPPSAELSAIASRFADQAGIALAEAERRQAEREAADLHARFEESLLPSITLGTPGVTLASFYRPGDDRLSLGGDFFDCLELPDGSIAMLIGDVAGHGARAAALGAGLRNAWRALVLGGWELERLGAGLQEVCVRERHDSFLFVTTITARVPPDHASLQYVSAGHPAPLVVGTAKPPPAPPNGPPIGVVRDPAWNPVTVPLGERATVVLYTDGLVEGRAEPGSVDRLGIVPIERLLRNADPGAVTAGDLARLVDLAAAAHGSGLPDDVALLALNLTR